MGWRDRDWAKFDEREWAAILAGPPQPAAQKRRGVTAVASSLVSLGLLASFAATVGVDAVHRLTRHTPAATPPASVVAIHWRDSDVSDAASAGRICVNDSRLGETCADYAAGEKPAAVLTRRLQALGVTVRSS